MKRLIPALLAVSTLYAGMSKPAINQTKILPKFDLVQTVKDQYKLLRDYQIQSDLFSKHQSDLHDIAVSHVLSNSSFELEIINVYGLKFNLDENKKMLDEQVNSILKKQDEYSEFITRVKSFELKYHYQKEKTYRFQESMHALNFILQEIYPHLERDCRQEMDKLKQNQESYIIRLEFSMKNYLEQKPNDKPTQLLIQELNNLKEQITLERQSLDLDLLK